MSLKNLSIAFLIIMCASCSSDNVESEIKPKDEGFVKVTPPIESVYE